MNNKTLGIAFGALLLIYLGIKFLGGPKERSFDPQVLTIDTASVTKVIIHPSAEGTEFMLERTSDDWVLSQAGQEFDLAKGSVNTLLQNLQSISADRVVSRNPERLEDYSVGPASGTHIEVFSNTNKVGDLMVGRFSFNQATRDGISYIKMMDQDEVFAVNGFASMTLTQAFDNYRNKVLIIINPADVTTLLWSNPLAQETIQNFNGVWSNQDETVIDSTSIASFLTGLQAVTGNAFLDDPNGLGIKLETLVIKGNNMVAPIEINCYQVANATKPMVIQSSLNPDAYFLTDSAGVYDRIFGKMEAL